MSYVAIDAAAWQALSPQARDSIRVVPNGVALGSPLLMRQADGRRWRVYEDHRFDSAAALALLQPVLGAGNVMVDRPEGAFPDLTIETPVRVPSPPEGNAAAFDASVQAVSWHAMGVLLAGAVSSLVSLIEENAELRRELADPRVAIDTLRSTNEALRAELDVLRPDVETVSGLLVVIRRCLRRVAEAGKKPIAAAIVIGDLLDLQDRLADEDTIQLLTELTNLVLQSLPG